jgi:hypothetical protein
MRDYDAWRTGWYDATREIDPGEEVNHICRKKTQNDWDCIQDAFIELVTLLKTNPDQAKINENIDWLAAELHVDTKLFNMGLL